jgi:hypothetical protein
MVQEKEDHEFRMQNVFRENLGLAKRGNIL